MRRDPQQTAPAEVLEKLAVPAAELGGLLT